MLPTLLERRGVRRAVGWLLTRGTLPLPGPDLAAGDALPDGSHADASDAFTWRVEGTRPAHAPASTIGALAGWRFALKDNFDVAGVGWTEGTAVARDVPERDAAMLTRLEQAGATLVGKAQMTELGLSGLGLQPHHGTLDNPAAPGHFAGGSSTGPAVLVARGEVRFAIGSDALGSVRIPAALCGLYGLKPTWGSFDTRGYRSLAPSLDMPGPITRTLDDLVAVYDALATRESVERHAATPSGRVLVSKVMLPAVQDNVAAVMRSARRLDLVPGPRPDFAAALAAALRTGLGDLRGLSTPPRAALETRIVLGLARCVDVRAELMATRERMQVRQHFIALLDRTRTDALLVPTTAIAAPARTRARMASRPEPGLHVALGIFTTLANVSGCPAITVPIGRDDRGRPLAAMLVGRPGAEHVLFALAARLEPAG